MQLRGTREPAEHTFPWFIAVLEGKAAEQKAVLLHGRHKSLARISNDLLLLALAVCPSRPARSEASSVS